MPSPPPDRDENSRLTPNEFENLLNVASRIGAVETMRSGAAFVDRVEFWKWMSESYPNVAARPGGWAAWIESKPTSAGRLFAGKVQEWDWVRDFKSSPRSLGRLAHVSRDVTARHDATVRNLLTGEVEKVESKFAGSRASAAGAIKNAQRKPGLGRLVGTPEVTTEAQRQGVQSGVAVEEYRAAAEGKKAADARMAKPPTAAAQGVTVAGALQQVGKGALLGAAISLTASTLLQFKAWRRGEITSEQFRAQLLHDSAKGGVKGAIIGGVNVGVQAAAISIGVGAPVTIPVMIVFSIAVDKIIDPAFGDGEYRRVLDELGYQADMAALAHDFALACQDAFDAMALVATNNEILRVEFAQLNAESEDLSDQIRATLEKI